MAPPITQPKNRPWLKAISPGSIVAASSEITCSAGSPSSGIGSVSAAYIAS
jgi:hypothetical protein